MRRKPHMLAGALALSLLALTGCGSSVQEPSASIFVICKSNDSYWDSVKAGAQEAGEEMNLRVLYDAPETESDIDSQIKMIDNAVSAGADAIVLAPLDKDALNEALERAKSADVPVLTIDSDVSFSGRRSCISTQNYAAGAIAARYVEGLHLGEGAAAIITHSNTAQTAQERTAGFLDELSGKDTTASSTPQQAAAEAIPGLEKSNGSSAKSGLRVLESKNGESNVQQSREAAVQLIRENSDLKLIYTTNLAGTMGACQAIEELGKANDVTLIGFDCFDGADAYIESGVLDAVVTQNPYNMGYLGVRYARKILRGEAVAREVDTGATLSTADNLHDEDIQFLIDPARKSTK